MEFPGEFESMNRGRDNMLVGRLGAGEGKATRTRAWQSLPNRC